MNIEGKIKALALVVSSDKTRSSLSRVKVIKKNDQTVDLVATDGHVLLLLKSIEWSDLVAYYKIAYSHDLPAEPVDELALFVSNKHRLNSNARWSVSKEDANGLEVSLFPYPKFESIIPHKFSNDINCMPYFSDALTIRASNIISLIKIGKNNKGTVNEFGIPHGWNTKSSGGIKFINDYIDGRKIQHVLLVMPTLRDHENLTPFEIPDVLNSDYFIDTPEED